jgi:hypothetical protein
LVPCIRFANLFFSRLFFFISICCVISFSHSFFYLLVSMEPCKRIILLILKVNEKWKKSYWKYLPYFNLIEMNWMKSRKFISQIRIFLYMMLFREEIGSETTTRWCGIAQKGKRMNVFHFKLRVRLNLNENIKKT